MWVVTKQVGEKNEEPFGTSWELDGNMCEHQQINPFLPS
jgi:hypothetical protein